MKKAAIPKKPPEAELVARGVRPDAKNRVALGKAVTAADDEVTYDVYRTRGGVIILEPKVSIPAAEAWLFRNPKALAAVRRGLREASEGAVSSLGSFAKYAEDSDDEA